MFKNGKAWKILQLKRLIKSTGPRPAPTALEESCEPMKETKRHARRVRQDLG